MPEMSEPLEFYVSNKERFMQQIRRSVGDYHLAEDLFSDIAVRLASLSKDAQYREEASMNTWLHRIVRNRCIQHHRYESRRRRLEEARIGIYGECYDVQCPRSEDPLKILMDREKEENLRLKLSELGRIGKEILIMQHWGGLEYSEIAEKLGIPVGTVKSRAHHARRVLKENLKHKFKSY